MKADRNPFDPWPRTAPSHFRLYFFAAVSHLIHTLRETFVRQDPFSLFPFLNGYANELSSAEPKDLTVHSAALWWQTTIPAWEQEGRDHLPLRALRDSCDLSHDAMTILFAVGLVEQDARFGSLFESMHGKAGQQRPTIGCLDDLWRGASQDFDTRATLKRLNELGLVVFANVEAPRSEWGVTLPEIFWDPMRGERSESPAKWALYHSPESFPEPPQLILSQEIRQKVLSSLGLLQLQQSPVMVVRGPGRNGRKTLLGSVARQMGRGLLEVAQLEQQDPRWSLIGPLATMLAAVPAITLSIPAGQTREVAPLNGYRGLTGFILGKHGGLNGPAIEGAITLNLEMPDQDMRRAHWQQSLGKAIQKDLHHVSDRFRLTGGNIRRAARLALATASIAGRTSVTASDVREASRSLNRELLDTLAEPVPTAGDWSCLALRSETFEELLSLEIRCCHRERLQSALGLANGIINSGVRALFSGPSGTGKTLAARVLASALQKDLYRLDLSAVVNKYIGETEKNLSRIFDRAEELDVILLLDEGDALLTRRTEVHNANDRYANLETNYLLQRLESFEGILIITTNAGDRIDRAFQRRMDIVVSFPPPDAQERWNIWQLHLPAGLGSSRVDLQACKLEYSIVSPK